MMHFTPSPTEENLDRSSVLPELCKIFASKLSICPFISLSDVAAKQEFGADFLCFNALETCEELRHEKPDLFDDKTLREIAMPIKNGLERANIDMICTDSIQLHDTGVISFSLHPSYLAKRLKEIVVNGIDTCAPLISRGKARAVFVSQPKTAVGDIFRGDYIRDALSQIYLYSGFGIHDLGVARSTDLSHELKIIERCGHEVDVIVHMMPVLQQDHMQPLSTATRSEESQAALVPCGYRYFTGNSEEELYRLFEHYRHQCRAFARKPEDAGYDRANFFLCALKYSFLKRHRLAECSFDIDEIVNLEGNTFGYLLFTRVLVRDCKQKPRGPVFLFESEEACAGKEERELAFHLVQFTAAVETACAGVAPHYVCEYLFVLSKLFNSYYNKVRPGKKSIFRAAEVVMDKCFDLLAINPGNEADHGPLLVDVRANIEHGKLDSIVEPCRELAEETRCKFIKSRFEIYSMTVEFDGGLDQFDVYGKVSIIDSFLARPDGWKMSDENDCCFVTYQEGDWHAPIETRNGACIQFGDPSGRLSVPFSSSIVVHVLVHIWSKNREQYYQICNVPGHDLPLLDFWNEQRRMMSGQLRFVTDAGIVGLNYSMLKEALDAFIDLSFISPAGSSLQLGGQIIAYYGDDEEEEEGGVLGQRKSVLFRAESTVLNGNQQLKMCKSTMAVPADGCLIIEAYLIDVNTDKLIVDARREFPARIVDNWCMDWKDSSLNLNVTWSSDA